MRAHDELVTAGARPRRDPTESRSNLTASELRVARMAAEGMTNREIAQALFLTENTSRLIFAASSASSTSAHARSSPPPCSAPPNSQDSLTEYLTGAP